MNWTEVSTKKLLAAVAGLFIIAIAIFITLSVKDTSLDKDNELNRIVHREVRNKTQEIEHLEASLDRNKKNQEELLNITQELDKKQLPKLDSLATGLKPKMDEWEFVKAEFRVRRAFFAPIGSLIDIDIETREGYEQGVGTIGYYDDVIETNYEFEIQQIFQNVFKEYFPYNRYIRADNFYYIGVALSDIAELKDKYSPQAFNRLKTKFVAQINNWKNDLEQSETELEQLITNNKEQLVQIRKEINTVRGNDLNRTIIKYVLPAFAVTVLLIMLIPVFLQSKNGVVHTFYNSKVMYKIITVFLLIGVIMILGIGGAISKEVLGTLLGGISAYVLNGSGKKGSTEVDEE